jgi:hypothetical protein
MSHVSQSPSRRERRKTLLMTLTFVFMLLYTASLTIDLFVPANLFWLTVALIVGCMASAVGWAKHLDEGKLNAHYVAWYWGGSAGLTVSALVFVALAPSLIAPNGMDAFVPAQIAPFATNASFAAGFMLGTIPAMIGYVAWWLVMVSRR